MFRLTDHVPNRGISATARTRPSKSANKPEPSLRKPGPVVGLSLSAGCWLWGVRAVSSNHPIRTHPEASLWAEGSFQEQRHRCEPWTARDGGSRRSPSQAHMADHRLDR
jgi:hypothetical protein